MGSLWALDFDGPGNGHDETVTRPGSQLPSQEEFWWSALGAGHAIGHNPSRIYSMRPSLSEWRNEWKSF